MESEFVWRRLIYLAPCQHGFLLHIQLDKYLYTYKLFLYIYIYINIYMYIKLFTLLTHGTGSAVSPHGRWRGRCGTRSSFQFKWTQVGFASFLRSRFKYTSTHANCLGEDEDSKGVLCNPSLNRTKERQYRKKRGHVENMGFYRQSDAIGQSFVLGYLGMQFSFQNHLQMYFCGCTQAKICCHMRRFPQMCAT